MVKALAKKITLVEGAHNWWKWFSTWCFASIAGIGGALALLPTDTLSGHIPFTAATTWRELGIAVIIFNAFIGPMVTAIRQNPPPSIKDLGLDFDPTEPGEEPAIETAARAAQDLSQVHSLPSEPSGLISLGGDSRDVVIKNNILTYHDQPVEQLPDSVRLVQMQPRSNIQYVPYVEPEVPAAFARTDCDHQQCPHPGVCQPAGRCVRPA